LAAEAIGFETGKPLKVPPFKAITVKGFVLKPEK
jgi:hypothetical protein